MRIMAVSHPSVTDVNQQFYAELEALGHQVHLIVPSNFRSAYSDSAIRVSRWPSFQGTIEERKVGLASNIPLHYYQTRLRPSMLKYRPDVLFVEEEPYSASAWQAYYASRNLRMKRVVYSAQNIYKAYPPPFRWMEQYVLANSDMAAVISEQVGEVICRKGFAGRLVPFPLGVDTNQFRPDPEARVRKRRELAAGESFLVGYVGRFVEEKGIRTLLEAVALTEGMPVSFAFVGNGPLLGDLQEAQRQWPERIIIADQVKHREVHEWMNAFDVLALPSLTMPNWKEQFGRVIIEAMACGVPVIGSDSGEIPVLIGKTGGGWYFPEGNASHFKSRVELVLKDRAERGRRAASGFAYVQETYSKKALAEAFAHALEDPVSPIQPGRISL